ncbi:hypothetical protein Sps_03968 [Shewanella psychrophila]|uniref:Pilus assembly protein E-set like domain-containing protein n=1 Tax=Shewanella psychrophila TaxID=225848 RepID=A0A1S6HU56_9GAMM|nr:TcfC E-set like domain-containing protein [Shewanella psychrophila]AQS39083.1 hypothetical protein Sps_03968 [Shewanella psychrophila]
MKHLNARLLIALPLALSSVASALAQTDYFPGEFSDFFDETPQQINVTVVGSGDGTLIKGLASYEVFRVNADSNAYNELKSYLLESQITPAAVDGILKQLVAGVTTDDACTGKLARCLVSPQVNSAGYVFDFDYGQLRIFVPSTSVKAEKTEVEYQSAFSESNALINSARLYGYTDFDGQNSGSMSNYTTIGLPLGYLTFDTQYKTPGNEFDLYTGLYTVDFAGNTLQVGRSRYNLSFNSTDLFNTGARMNLDGAFIGSSRNLIKGSPESHQRIYYYAPQLGQLEVYRGDRLILSQVVSEGQQFLSYENLPKGVYEITIILKVSGSTVLTERRQVVNNNQFSIPVGEFDYVFGAGRLGDYDLGDGPISVDSLMADYNNYDRNIVKASSTYRFTEALLFGGSATIGTDEQYLQLGGSYNFSEQLSFDFVHGSFLNAEDFYQRGSLSYSGMFMDYRRYEYDAQNTEYRMSSHLYGLRSFEDIGVGISGQLIGANAYLRASYYTSNDVVKVSSAVIETQSDSWSLSGGLTKSFDLGTLNVNASYKDNGSIDDDSRISLSWTMPFGDSGISAQSSVYVNQDGFDRNVNYLRGDFKGDHWRSNVSAGAQVFSDNTVMGDLSATASTDTDYFTANSYGYTNDRGEKTLTGGFSSTQVLSSNGLSFTRDNSRSYAHVVASTQDEDFSPKLKLGLSKDGRYSRRVNVSDSASLLALQEYSAFDFDFDASGQNVELKRNRVHKFTYPGTVFNVAAAVTELASQILVLDDIFGNPISSVQCLGDACISAEPLSDDGVFRVNYHKNADFRLLSRKGLCIYEGKANDAKRKVLKGFCLPGLEQDGRDKWDKSSHLLQGDSKEETLVYLGQFTLGKDAENIIARLNNQNIAFTSVSVAGKQYIYVTDIHLTSEKRQLLQELDAYVLIKDSELDLLTLLDNQEGNDA